MAKYFGTNGVRGTFDMLTPALTLQIAQAVGTYFKGGCMLVARDHRLTSPALHSAVLAGLQRIGCRIVDLGVVPAPTAEFLIRPLRADGLIIITASHNPPEWNGLKVVDAQGIGISRERGEKIEQLMEKSLSSASARWDQTSRREPYASGISDHVAAMLRLLPVERIRKRKPKLILDFGNGTVGLVAPQLFQELGCELVTLNSHLDGRFPGRPSEPTEANVSDLLAAVKAAGADAGVAWDGDGDRVVFVDEHGSYVIGDKVFALAACWQLKTETRKKPKVVTTVATSRVVEDTAQKFGASIAYTKIGAPYLSEAMVQEKALLGGEEVGGVIWPELSLAKDGIFTAAKLAEALCEKPLSAWVQELPVYFNEKIKLEANAKEKEKILQRIRAYAVKNKLKPVEIDGVRINFPDSWVIVRASGTENYVRIFAEAKSAARAKELVQEYQKLADKK